MVTELRDACEVPTVLVQRGRILTSIPPFGLAKALASQFDLFLCTVLPPTPLLSRHQPLINISPTPLLFYHLLPENPVCNIPLELESVRD